MNGDLAETTQAQYVIDPLDGKSFYRPCVSLQ